MGLKPVQQKNYRIKFGDIRTGGIYQLEVIRWMIIHLGWATKNVGSFIDFNSTTLKDFTTEIILIFIVATSEQVVYAFDFPRFGSFNIAYSLFH